MPQIGTIANALCPGGSTPGDHATAVDGCTAVSGGGGNWIITLLAPNNGAADSDVLFTLTPAPGSNASPDNGVCFGVSSGGPGVYSVNAYRNDTAVAVDLPYYFECRRRR